MKEEQSVYDRCGSKKMYLNLAVKTLKKLRDHGSFDFSEDFFFFKWVIDVEIRATEKCPKRII